MNYQNTQQRSGLLNLIAEFSVKLLKEDNQTKTSINVTDCKNFIVINGQTNSSKLFNVNDLRSEFTKEMSNMTSLFDISNLNIFELIEYQKLEPPTTMNFTFYNSSIPRYSQPIIDMVTSLQDTDYSELYEDGLGVDVSYINENSYWKPMVSSFPYGYSLKDWKIVFLYLEYVSLNIFPTIKGDMINYTIDKENNIIIKSDSMYDSENIVSMVKDVFDFDFDSFKAKIEKYNMVKDCLIFSDRPWLVKDKVRESIIF
jgi:hypothetical protein